MHEPVDVEIPWDIACDIAIAGINQKRKCRTDDYNPSRYMPAGHPHDSWDNEVNSKLTEAVFAQFLGILPRWIAEGCAVGTFKTGSDVRWKVKTEIKTAVPPNRNMLLPQPEFVGPKAHPPDTLYVFVTRTGALNRFRIEGGKTLSKMAQYPLITDKGDPPYKLIPPHHFHPIKRIVEHYSNAA